MAGSPSCVSRAAVPAFWTSWAARGPRATGWRPPLWSDGESRGTWIPHVATASTGRLRGVSGRVLCRVQVHVPSRAKPFLPRACYVLIFKVCIYFFKCFFLSIEIILYSPQPVSVNYIIQFFNVTVFLHPHVVIIFFELVADAVVYYFISYFPTCVCKR